MRVKSLIVAPIKRPSGLFAMFNFLFPHNCEILCNHFTTPRLSQIFIIAVQSATASSQTQVAHTTLAQCVRYKNLKIMIWVVAPLCVAVHGTLLWFAYYLSLDKLDEFALLGFCGLYVCLLLAYDLEILSLVHSAGRWKAMIPILDAEGGEKGILAKFADIRKKQEENGNAAKKYEMQKYTRLEESVKIDISEKISVEGDVELGQHEKARTKKSRFSKIIERYGQRILVVVATLPVYALHFNSMCIAGGAVAAGRQSDLLADSLLFVAITVLLWWSCVYMVYLDGKSSINSIITDTCDENQVLLELRLICGRVQPEERLSEEVNTGEENRAKEEKLSI